MHSLHGSTFRKQLESNYDYDLEIWPQTETDAVVKDCWRFLNGGHIVKMSDDQCVHLPHQVSIHTMLSLLGAFHSSIRKK